jgi:hypothetical protein
MSQQPLATVDPATLKAHLAVTQHTPDSIAAKFQSVHGALLNGSARIREPNFGLIGTADLGLLFDLYDAAFFDNRLRQLLHALGSPLSFKLSRRLTRSAGTTTRFQARGLRPGQTVPAVRYEIAISTTLLYQTFSGVERTVRVSGLVCQDRTAALQRIFEHEVIHLLEMLVWDKSSCAAERFRELAWNIFGHTESRHDLVTGHEQALRQFAVRVGDRVAFDFEGRRYEGIVNRITRRATILVEDPRGALYGDGKHYAKFYVPLQALEKVGP